MGKLVFLNNNRPVTDSLTVAASFEKEHRRVLQDIREVLNQVEAEWGMHHFVQTTYENEQNGQHYPKYLITEQGFTLLVMGYTGSRAMKFKIDYINEFDRMKSELTKPQFQLPQTMPEALRLLAAQIEETESVKAQNAQLEIETQEQKQKLKEQEAPVAIYNLAISAHNTMSMQEVAKAFNTGRTRLYNILREEGIVMKHSTLPYQRFIDAGYFKVVERPRASGDSIHNDPATRVTAKGFDYVAKIMHRRNTNLSLVGG